MLSWKDMILTPVHQWLTPSSRSCLTCGKMIRAGGCGVKGFTQICTDCYALIPWITVPRCQVCGRAVGCPDCSRAGQGARYFLMNRSAVQYNATMREWLAQYKFRGNESLGPLLAQMMNYTMRAMAEELREKAAAPRDFVDIVTFVPVSEERMLERGFNQSRALAYGAASASRAPVLELLRRSRHTEKQSSKNRRQRLLELEGLFLPLPDAVDPLKEYLLSKYEHLAERPVRLLLIDDVYTTGSTMDTCAAVLHGLCRELGHPAEIYSMTWARS